MAFTPRFALLLKVMLRRRDPAAAEGLFLDGSVEFESGDLEGARLAFYYGTKLDPGMAGNFYNYAVATEKLKGETKETLKAWRAYLEAADRDPRQKAEQKSKAREHAEQLAAKLGEK